MSKANKETIMALEEEFVPVKMVADLFGSDLQDLRDMMREKPNPNGFNYQPVGNTFKIPKDAFIRWMGWE